MKQIATVLLATTLVIVTYLYISEDSDHQLHSFIVPINRIWKNSKIGEHGTGNDLFQEPHRGAFHIIFIESSCALKLPDKSAVSLNPRQACAVESAARANPNVTIYLFDTCFNIDNSTDSHNLSGGVFKILISTYSNIKVFHFDLESFLFNTPLFSWLHEGKLRSSIYPIEHSSDVVRLVSMWKYGGVYLDLDFIVRRPLSDLGLNYFVAETEDSLGNSVLAFTHDGLGHQVSTMCLEEIRRDFQGDEWTHNGPDVLDRVMHNLCTIKKTNEMTKEKCQGFKAQPPDVFFPFPYQSWEVLFRDSPDTMAKIKRKNSHAIHAWNKLSKQKKVKVGSNQLYARLASIYCPVTYNNSGVEF